MKTMKRLVLLLKTAQRKLKSAISLLLIVTLLAGTVSPLSVSANTSIVNTLNGVWTVQGLGSATITCTSSGQISGVAAGYPFSGTINLVTRAISVSVSGAYPFYGFLDLNTSTITGTVTGYGNVTLTRSGSIITTPSDNSSGFLDYDDEPFIISSDLDPVCMATGNFTLDYTDFSLHGAEPLNFTRHYNSGDTHNDELGYGWRHNFMYSVDVETTRATVHMADGERVVFDRTGGNFVPTLHANRTLQAYGNGYVLSDRAQNKHYFDSDGRLTAIEDSIGNTTEITRSGTEIETITNRSGTLNFTYENNKITQITDQTGRSVYYEYNANNTLRTFTNADNDTLEYEYTNNRVTKITDFNGNIFLQNTYDTQGRVTRQDIPDQGTSTIAYNLNDRITTVTDSTGVRRYFYNALGQITAVEDNVANIEYVYENGRLVRTIDGLGNSVAFTHDNAGNRTSISYFYQGSNTPHAVEYFEYNSRNLVTKHTQRDGSVIEFTHDTNGKITSITDNLGNTHTFTYDSQNNMLTSTDPLGNTTTFTYDAVGNVLTQTDPLGNVTAFEYDNLGRLTKQTNPDGGEIDFAYSPAGKLLQTTDPLGGVHHFTVDGNGFNTATTDPLANSTTITRNAQNKPTTTTDPRNNTTHYTYDLTGNLTKVTDTLNNETTYTHDQRGRITSMTDPRENTWTFTFDAENRMTSETDPLNNTTTFDYDLFGNLTHLTTPSGNTLASVFDGMGRRIKTIDPQANETAYEYDNAGRLTRITNADSTYSELTYNSAGWLTSVKDETQAVTSYEYNANGQLTQLTDPLGGVTAFAYDAMGRIIAETNAMGGVTSYTYDQNSNILTITDPMNGVTTFTYDLLNRISTVTDPLDGVTSYEYYPNGNITQITNAENGVTTFVYDSLNRITSSTNPEGYTVTFAYDENGNVITKTDGRGNAAHFEYDELNRLTVVTDEAGNIIEKIYDQDSRIIKTIDQLGVETAYEYNANGQIVSVSDPLNNQTTVEYDIMNRISKTTDANGNSMRFSYTPTGLLEMITDAATGVTSFEYDMLGQLIAETNPNNETTTYTRDPLGRVTAVTNALGHAEHFAYDQNNRITTVTDRNGEQTHYTYDSNSNLTTATDAEGVITRFEYDRLNRLVKVTSNANDNTSTANTTTTANQITLYEYDGRGLVTKVINTVGNEKLYIYDQNGNLISTTDEDGYTTTYVHNAKNLLETITHADNRTATLAYNAAGQLVQLADWTGTTDFTLDLLGRVTEINDQNNRTVGYTYDPAGNQTQINYSDNTSVTRIFDNLNRVTSIQTADGIFNYTRDPEGRIKALAMPNGITEAYTHDSIGQLLTVTQTNPDNTTELLSEYTYDPTGNVLSQTSAFNSSLPNSITLNQFNALNQLTTQTEMGVQGSIFNRFEYVYDNRGNLIEERDTINNTTQTYTFDSTNRMTHGINHQGEESIYHYNALNALIGRETITDNGTFANDLVLDYTSLVPTVLMEYGTGTSTSTPPNDIIKRHTYGNEHNGLSRISTNLTNVVNPTNPPNPANPTQTETFFIQNDRLGSGVRATDLTGTQVARTELDIWGNVLEKTMPTFADRQVDILNMFTNYTHDDVLGLYFSPSRMYDSSTMRFTSADPYFQLPFNIFNDGMASIRQFHNKYAYALNNPLLHVDPTGKNLPISSPRPPAQSLLGPRRQIANNLPSRWSMPMFAPVQNVTGYMARVECAGERSMAVIDDYLKGIHTSESSLNSALMWFATNGNQSSIGSFDTDKLKTVLNGEYSAYADTTRYDLNRFDTQILGFANYFNLKYSREIDANDIKVIALIESKMGYFAGSATANGAVDVMQVLDRRNPAIQRLAAQGNFDPNEGARLMPREGFGLFQDMYDDGTYAIENATIEMSIIAGIIWYAHKGSFQRYNGGGDSSYTTKAQSLREIMH